MPGYFPPVGLARYIANSLGSRGIYFLAQRLLRSVPGEDRFQLLLALNILKDYHVLIYSPRLMINSGSRFPPVVFDDQDAMFRRASQILRKKEPEAEIFYHGGVSYPTLEKMESSH